MQVSLQGEMDVDAVVPGAVCHRGVVYGEVSGFRPLLLDLYVPAAVPGPVPCVVWVHGGAWEFGDRRFQAPGWPPGLLFSALVEAGLAVATVDYRLSAEARYPAQLDDVRRAVRFLRDNSHRAGIDAGRLGVAGDSAGGHLAAMAALTGTGSDRLQAAAILYGVTDLAGFDTSALSPQERADTPEARLLGVTPSEHHDVSAEASPVHHATAAAPPMLLISGDADRVVPVAQTERLHALLVDAGAPDVVLEIVAGADHCFDGVDPRPPLRTVVEFLADRLLRS
jgi:acetyl esterase/lipase